MHPLTRQIESDGKRNTVSRTRNGFLAGEPLLLIAVILGTLYFAQALLIPLALALTLNFLLAPAVLWLERVHIPRTPAVGIVVVVAFCLIAGIGWVVTSQLLGVAIQLPNYRTNIRDKIIAAHKPTEGSLGQAVKMIEDIGEEAIAGTSSTAASQAADKTPRPETAKPTQVQVVEPVGNQFNAIRELVLRLLKIVGMGVIVLVFTIYMLEKREDLRNRLLLLAGMSHISLMSRALEDAATRISQYLVLQFAVNAAYGICFGGALYLINIPNATLWGVIAGILRVVPYVGTAIGCLLPLIFSFAVFPTWWPPLMVLTIFILLELITANFLEPWLYGSRTGISSLALLATAIFWTVFWGWHGLVLSTPLTVCLIVMGRYVPQLSFLHILLGDEAELAPEARFYERLLAMDQAEAHSIADRFLSGHKLLELYDTILIPALTLAEEDRHKGSLDESKSNFLFLSASELVAELSEYHENSATEEPNPIEKAQDKCAVICIPAAANDQADELTAMMLAQLLERNSHHTLLLSPTSVTAEVLSKLAEEQRTVICISALPPFAFTATRTLCQQIRHYLPHNRIVIGMWNSEATGRKSVEQFGAGRPDAVLNTLAEVLVKVEGWDADQALQPAAQIYPKRERNVPADMSSYPGMPLSPDPKLVTDSE
jgi:predicted PurR-regulated permease PerM